VIREHRAEAERERRLSPPVLAALHDAGLLRLCTPRALGGLEADPLTRALAIEEISGLDTAAGWTLANSLDQAYLCACLPGAGAPVPLHRHCRVQSPSAPPRGGAARY
jgi:alkylation response protein AidB-like acyl-CoA dehydrogenase